MRRKTINSKEDRILYTPRPEPNGKKTNIYLEVGFTAARGLRLTIAWGYPSHYCCTINAGTTCWCSCEHGYALGITKHGFIKNTILERTCHDTQQERPRTPPRQSPEGRARWGMPIKQRAEKWTSSRITSTTAQNLVKSGLLIAATTELKYVYMCFYFMYLQ